MINNDDKTLHFRTKNIKPKVKKETIRKTKAI